MPAKSKAQQIAMQIAEHHPEKLYERNKGMAKMTHKQLHEFASGSEKGKPEYKNPSKRHAPHNPGRITHVHQHLQTEHTPPHKGKTVDGHDHDGHVAGSMPEHDHHGLTHHYTHEK